MTQSGPKVIDWCWFIACAVISSIWCLGAAAELGATFDETGYVRHGLDAWRRGSHETFMRIGTMPLAADVATLPLYLYERITGTRIRFYGADFDTALFWARATSLVFWWQLLFFAGVVGRHLAGPWGGRLAIALLACEPNFLAHASLATTDIAAAAFFLPMVYYFAVGRDQSWPRRIGIPALWFGVALFAKASALAYGPIAWLVIETHRLWRLSSQESGVRSQESGVRGQVSEADALTPDFCLLTPDSCLLTPDSCLLTPGSWKGWCRTTIARYRPWWSDVWRIGVIGLAIVFVLVGCDWTTQPSFVRWAHELPDGTFGKEPMVWLADNLKIFSNAGHGLVYQIRHNVRGHSAYLLGEAAPRSIWFYYPVLITMKLPLVILALPLVIAVIRPRALGNWACLVAAALLVYSLNCKVQIGIRLMLPWIALGIVGLAAALVNAWQQLLHPSAHPLTPSPPHPFAPSSRHPVAPSSPFPVIWRRRLLAGVAVTSVGWLALTAATIWPHGLCYINELWGGPEHGYKLVSDSNYDWGQGLRELARWQQEREIKELDVWYFGTDPLVAKLPMRQIHASQLSASELLAKVQGRRLAVGTTWLYGSYKQRDAELPGILRELQPVARTRTFLIYDFTAASPFQNATAAPAAAQIAPPWISIRPK